MLRRDNDFARQFYLVETEKEFWSVMELDRQISSMLYERLALSSEKNKLNNHSERMASPRNEKQTKRTDNNNSRPCKT
ncbi:hypothetical protein HY636_04315 [Candidatus Woesearchaeota archaeon]|nr:hypothetical protein [Candidatus Woesearchaeota archaeon]